MMQRVRCWFARRALVVLAALCSHGLVPVALAQQSGTQQRGLELESARIRYAEAQTHLERARELHREKLIPRAQLEEEETRLRLARVELRRSYLNLVQSDPQLVISKARKYRGQGGEARVALTVAALWATGPQLQAVDEVLEETLGTPGFEGFSNVIVSLKTVRGYREGVMLEPTIISIPYEKQLPFLPFNSPVVVDFGLLLPNVREVLVELRQGDRRDQRQVLLGKGAGEDQSVVLRSTQIALEAEFSGEASYPLTVERFASRSATYDLSFKDVPAEISIQLKDPTSGSALSRVFFPEGVTSRELSLILRLPSRPTLAVRPDTPLVFSVELTSEEAAGADSPEAGPRRGALELQLVPRGVAALELEANNLYHELEPAGVVALEVRIRNSGSRTLEQVELTTAVPYGWRATAAPPLLASLRPGAVEITTLTISPPADVPVGDYEGTIIATTLAGERAVRSSSKTLRLHVKARVRLWLTVVLVLFLVVILAAIVYGGVRLTAVPLTFMQSRGGAEEEYPLRRDQAV